jgi:hypothetical protein
VPALYRPSAEDRARIRAAAATEAHIAVSAVVLQIGRRRSLKSRDNAINIAMISEDPAFADTDLDDYEPWSSFTNGVPLTDSGAGIFDFYIRRRGDRDEELQGNVTVYVAHGQISRIHGYPDEY